MESRVIKKTILVIQLKTMGLISFIKDLFCADGYEREIHPVTNPPSPDKSKLKVIAKYVHCNDAEYMYHCKEEQPGCCPVCYCKLQEVPNLAYRMGRRRNDMYCTYDGYFLVSNHFKRFCEERGYPNLVFIKLPKTHGFYFFTCKEETFPLDEQWLWHSVDKQSCCGVYYEMGGPFTIKRKDIVLHSDDFIAKSPMLASGNHKSPCIIIGLSTMKAMQDYGLKGLYFHDVYELME